LAIYLVFDPLRRYPIPRGVNIQGGKILRFSTEISVYLGNGARYDNGYYGTLTGSHGWRIDPCRSR